LTKCAAVRSWIQVGLTGLVLLGVPVVIGCGGADGGDNGGSGGKGVGSGGGHGSGGVLGTGGGGIGSGGQTSSGGSNGGGGQGSGGSMASGGSIGSGGQTSTGGSRGAAGQSGSGGAGIVGTGGTDGGVASRIGVCDIFASGSTPCVAAHSTVRALYGAYSGSLYQVTRASDKTTKDIGVLTAGGFADATAQDSFCAGTTCTISIIYDQSGKKNHLTQAPAGQRKATPDNLADAAALKFTISGHTVYGVHLPPGFGYRNDGTSGVATGDQPETEYMVTSGTYFNGSCCWDYGNAETNNRDDGAGTMEAVYFGNYRVQGKGGGNGPWVMADMENGVFAGPSFAANPMVTPLTFPYVTALVIGRSGSFALRGGNAQMGTLTTMYDGVRANGYNPMKKQGAIILGIGGDNTAGGQGNFYEGVLTMGAASNATTDAVQANIVAARYGM
jgi:non-reducing end alpha-L-arabinofuranosidase